MFYIGSGMLCKQAALNPGRLGSVFGANAEKLIGAMAKGDSKEVGKRSGILKKLEAAFNKARPNGPYAKKSFSDRKFEGDFINPHRAAMMDILHAANKYGYKF